MAGLFASAVQASAGGVAGSAPALDDGYDARTRVSRQAPGSGGPGGDRADLAGDRVRTGRAGDPPSDVATWVRGGRAAAAGGLRAAGWGLADRRTFEAGRRRQAGR